MLAVVGKQARIELGEAAAAGATGALGGENLHFALEHVHDAFAVLERGAQRLAKLGFGFRLHLECEDRQLDRVFAKTIDARERPRRQELPVDAQMPVALARGPFREIGVVALARHNQRRQQSNVLAAILA